MNKSSYLRHLQHALLATSLTLSGLHTAVAQTPTRTVAQEANRIMVLVNSEPITTADLRSRIARIQNTSNTNLPPLAELERQVLERLIVERTQIQWAKEIGIKVDDAMVREAESNIAQQNSLSVAQLHARLSEMGNTIATFRNNLRDEITLQRVREREVDSRVRVTEVDIDAYLREHSAATNPAQTALNLANLLIAVPDNATPSAVAILQTRANELAARARAGEDFSTLARQHSDGAERNAGGEMGLASADRYPPLFLQAIGSASRGAIVGPLRSGAGFHILKVLDKRNANLPDPFVTQTRARHILMIPTAQRSAEATAAQLARVRAQIAAGQLSFEEAARQFSQDGSAAGGGDLGWANPGQFVPEFESVMDDLNPGDISVPTPSRFGVHLIQVVDRREVEITEAQRRAWVRNVLREQKEDEAYEEWARDLRARAFVEYRDN
jgi:peptidyl-prolyl cis-trans isomerase SurA